VFIYFLAARFGKEPDWLTPLLVFAIPAGLLTSMYFQPYDLFLCLPSIICLGTLDRNRRLPANLSVFAGSAILIFVFPIYTYLYFRQEPVNPYVLLLLAFCACGWLTLRRSQEFSGSAAPSGSPGSSAPPSSPGSPGFGEQSG
jgi:hypothetical protein